MAKAKKPASRPSTKLASSLPPAVVEQAAQEWLEAHGIAASKTPSAQPDPSCHALTEVLTQTIQTIHRELNSLHERVARLEKNRD